MEKVVQLSDVTRGALYHHFKGKEELFHAVFVDALDEITKRCEQALSVSNDPWENLTGTTRAFFDACSEPELRQIVLIDAPAILGWSVWRETDETRTMAMLKDILTELINNEVIKSFPVDILAHIIGGATSELVLLVANSENSDEALTQGVDAMIKLFESLKNTAV